MNSSWPRWIAASCLKYFEDNKGSYSLFANWEDQEKDNKNIWAIFQLEGPIFKETTRGIWRVDANIVILNTVILAHDYSYTIYDITGYFASLFTCIPIYKFGPTPDDKSFVENFNLKGPIDIKNYGNNNSRVLQSTITGAYKMYLEGN